MKAVLLVILSVLIWLGLTYWTASAFSVGWATIPFLGIPALICTAVLANLWGRG
jgi:hypothetical protein